MVRAQEEQYITEQRLAVSERVPFFVAPIPRFAALGAPWVPRAHFTPAGESHRLTGKTDQEVAWLMPPSRRCPRRGQVVIPEEIRARLGLKAGAQCLVLGDRDVVILKVLKEIGDSAQIRRVWISRFLCTASGLSRWVWISRILCTVTELSQVASEASWHVLKHNVYRDRLPTWRPVPSHVGQPRVPDQRRSHHCSGMTRPVDVVSLPILTWPCARAEAQALDLA